MITREDIQAGKVDLRDEGDELLAPVHPGAHLRDWLEEAGISAYALAKAMKVPANRLGAILLGERAITADTAIRLGKALGTTAEMWLNLQIGYDLEVARRAQVGADVQHIAA